MGQAERTHQKSYHFSLMGALSLHPSYKNYKNTHYSKFISLIVSGSLLPQSRSYKPRLTAFLKELFGQSHGLATNPCFTGL
jgi:hypothetical protein